MRNEIITDVANEITSKRNKAQSCESRQNAEQTLIWGVDGTINDGEQRRAGEPAHTACQGGEQGHWPERSKDTQKDAARVAIDPTLLYLGSMIFLADAPLMAFAASGRTASAQRIVDSLPRAEGNGAAAAYPEDALILPLCKALLAFARSRRRSRR